MYLRIYWKYNLKKKTLVNINFLNTYVNIVFKIITIVGQNVTQKINGHVYY